MSRAWSVRVVVGLFALAAFFVLWTLAYEVTVAARWNPTLPGEGAARFDLLKAQNAARDWRALSIGWNHFLARLAYPATQAETLLRGLIAAAVVLALGGVLTVVRVALRKPMPFGDARFATILDAERKGLTGKNGLALGWLNGALLHSDDPSHVLVVGPTRSGKGVSFVIPNGFLWQGSSVWFDPKRENFEAFGAYRQNLGDRVFMFSPGERDSHRYNPLDFIRRDERMPTDCNVVASFIVPEGVGSSEIWSRAARQLLSAMIGYVVASPRYEGRRHMRAVTLLTATGQDFRKVLKSVVDGEADALPPWVVQGFNQFIALEPETRNSALFNVTAALNPWTSDLIAAVTATSDFDIRELRRMPMAIFIGCSIAQLDVYRPIIKILVQQIHDLMMAAMPGPDEPHKVLVMIDEFRQLGRMDALVSKLTINLGYNFRMVLILQDLGQLDEVYGKPVRITTVSACQVKLFIRINDLETSQYVSEMLGATTAEIRTPIIRANQGLFSGRDKSVSYQERPLMSPEELRMLDPTKAILLIPNTPGFELTKALYYKDGPFRAAMRAFIGKKLKVPSLPIWNDAPKAKDVVAPAAPAPRIQEERDAARMITPAGSEMAIMAGVDRQAPAPGAVGKTFEPASELRPFVAATTAAAVASKQEAASRTEGAEPLVGSSSVLRGDEARLAEDATVEPPLDGRHTEEVLVAAAEGEDTGPAPVASVALRPRASIAALQAVLKSETAASIVEIEALAPADPSLVEAVEIMRKLGWAAQ
jgi:type IV secretion system protein VirD4